MSICAKMKDMEQPSIAYVVDDFARVLRSLPAVRLDITFKRDAG